MKTFTSKFQGKLNQIMVCCLAIFSIAGSVGCSTPRVEDYSSGPDEVAWDAYSNCIQAVGPYGDQRLCNNYSSMQQISLSYNQYVLGELNGTNQNQSQSSSYGTGSFRGAETSSEFDSSYRNYLSTLDADTLQEMTIHWQSVAENYSQSE